MAKAQENHKNVQVTNYSIQEDGTFGGIHIADEVIATISGIAATEVEGVAKMAGNITNELVSRMGIKNLSKGVKVIIEAKKVMVELTLEITYGYKITDVSKKVQEKVSQAIESMTGLKVDKVDVRISGVAVNNEQ